MFDRIKLVFGSESGNAEQLAQRMFTWLQHEPREVSCRNLDELKLADLNASDLLLVITSTFGDGVPPGNAKAFAQRLSETIEISPCQYAVFGLGDTEYPNFCRFGKTVDARLAEKGARRLVNRVDADLDYQYFFARWEHCIADILAGKTQDGLGLELRVEAYSENHPYTATVQSVEQFSDRSEGVYDVKLNIRSSGMNYRAGDLLYVLPDDDPALYSELACWFEPDEDVSLLAGKEVRLLNKSLLRVLARASGNSTLKEYLKIKNKSALDNYLAERDLLDVLRDCGEPGFISVMTLAGLLSPRSARAYWIASCGMTDGGTKDSIHLGIRDVAYQAFGRHHNGAASHSLCQAKSGDQFSVFVRSNPDFWLDAKQTTPVLMIGEGTGIVPYIGFLQALENSSHTRNTMLVYGEQDQTKALYQSELTTWLQNGVLNSLKTTCSSPQTAQYSVHHMLLDAAADVYQMLEQEAHIYICGSKRSLDKPVDQALQTIIQKHAMCSESQARDRLQQLYTSGQIHKNLH